MSSSLFSLHRSRQTCQFQSFDWRTLVIATVIALMCAGCGGASSAVPAPTPVPQAITITAQPSSQAVRIGQTATFTVTATGSEPITYQWNRNGTLINGANSASYTTPTTVASDNDSIFNVKITNPAGSVTSGTRRLILNSPQDSDLRFQQVDAISTRDLYLGYMSTGIVGNTAMTWGDYGAPLRLTPLGHCGGDVTLNCAWFFNLFQSPATGLTTGYQPGLLSNLQNDVSALPANTVVTSLDLEPANNAYAISLVKSSTGGSFTPMTIQSVLPADFQTVASQQAALGRVITAVGFNGGLVLYLSYGWQSDLASVYEAQVVTATLATIPAQASALAQQGYILTAVGGDTTNGFLVVGTRVQGDTMPRPLRIVTSPAEDVNALLWSQGYALVVAINNGLSTATTWIGEK